MGIPDELWILGRLYEIVETGSAPATEGIVLGCAQYTEARILLNKDPELECQLKTLWHEACHIWQQDMQGRMDEDLANLVSAFVHTMLVHNRELADCYCTHGEEDDN